MKHTGFQIGDIGFVIHRNNVLSRLIAWFCSGEWSHSFLVLDAGSSDRTYVSETSNYEVTIGWIERYTEDPKVAMEVIRLPNLSASDASAIAERALSQEERVYPYWQFLSLALKGLLSKIGVRIPNMLPFGYDCNEHVHYAEQASNLSWLTSVNPQSIQIEEFYHLVKSIPGAVTIYKKDSA